MARYARVSPLTKAHLKATSDLFLAIAGVYADMANSLSGERKSVKAINLKQLVSGVERLMQHGGQLASPFAREEIGRLLDSIREEPLPEESYERTKTGKKTVTAKTGPKGTTKTAKVPRKKKGT